MIPYIEHHIVDHCNLKCAGCSHFSCISDPWFEDLDAFQHDFTQLAALTNHYIPLIRIMGGEPLLHPDVKEFLRITRALFPGSTIHLVTNGLLLKQKKEELMDFCNENHIVICTSNYGILNLAEILSGFKYTRVDSKVQMYNISLHIEGGRNQNLSFNMCDLHLYKWYYFQRGRFYPCCIVANFYIFDKKFNTNIRDWTEDDISISVYNHTLSEIEEFLNKPIPLCSYCNTIRRAHSYHPFSQTKEAIEEWTCQ